MYGGFIKLVEKKENKVEEKKVENEQQQQQQQEEEEEIKQEEEIKVVKLNNPDSFKVKCIDVCLRLFVLLTPTLFALLVAFVFWIFSN